MHTLLALLESEFLWGILIGGMTTVLGAVVTISYQFYKQNRDLERYTLRFIDDQISVFLEMIGYIDTYRNADGKIDYHILANLLDAMDVVHRQLEVLCRISDEQLSLELRGTLAALRIRARQTMYVAAVAALPPGADAGAIVPAPDLAAVRALDSARSASLLQDGLADIGALAGKLRTLQARIRRLRGAARGAAT